MKCETCQAEMTLECRVECRNEHQGNVWWCRWCGTILKETFDPDKPFTAKPTIEVKRPYKRG